MKDESHGLLIDLSDPFKEISYHNRGVRQEDRLSDLKGGLSLIAGSFEF